MHVNAFAQVSAVCVQESTLSVCVLSREPDGKRHAVGRVLFPLEGELGLAGRVLWKDLELEDDAQVVTHPHPECKKVIPQAYDCLIPSVLRAGGRPDFSVLQFVSTAPLGGGFESTRPPAANRCR